MGRKQKKSSRKSSRKSNRASNGASAQKAAVYQGFQVNRKYKDNLFRMVFKSREALLSLYNAINKSHYENPEDLEITTIEDVVYIGVKNDVSFLIDSFMNLYEYAYFVDQVRYYLEQYQGQLEYAVDCAVSECIQADILKEFLIRHRAEVKTVILTEYDAKQHIEAEKSESYLEGKADGEARLLRLMDLMEADGRAEQILRLRKDAEFLKQMYKQYGIEA